MHVLYNHYVLKCFYRSPSGPHKLGLSCHVVGEGLGLGFIHGVCANFGLVGPHPRAICERLRDRSHGLGLPGVGTWAGQVFRGKCCCFGMSKEGDRHIHDLIVEQRKHKQLRIDVTMMTICIFQLIIFHDRVNCMPGSSPPCR